MSDSVLLVPGLPGFIAHRVAQGRMRANALAQANRAARRGQLDQRCYRGDPEALRALAEGARFVVEPIPLQHASAFVNAYHRHHHAPPGHCFSLGLIAEGRAVRLLVGVAMVGRPVARLAPRDALEVNRLATCGTPRGPSTLLRACEAEVRARYPAIRRLITYTLASEHGYSLRAARWRPDGTTTGGQWDCPSRPRADRHPTGPKRRWTRAIT